MEILVPGKDIDWKTDETVTNSQVIIKDYFYELINKNKQATFANYFPAEEIYKIFLKEIDKRFNEQLGYASFDALLENTHYDRIIAFLYTIPFEGQSRQTVTVQYETFGAVDRRETPTPLITFDYLLNPAKNWHDFNDLTITIHTHDDAPYIVNSTIDFVKEDKQTYTAYLEKLPDTDLTFTLYKNEKVTVVDKVVKNVTSPFFLIFAVPAVMIGLFILLISIIVVTYKKKKI